MKLIILGQNLNIEFHLVPFAGSCYLLLQLPTTIGHLLLPVTSYLHWPASLHIIPSHLLTFASHPATTIHCWPLIASKHSITSHPTTLNCQLPCWPPSMGNFSFFFSLTTQTGYHLCQSFPVISQQRPVTLPLPTNGNTHRQSPTATEHSVTALPTTVNCHLPCWLPFYRNFFFHCVPSTKIISSWFFTVTAKQ